MTLVQMVPQPVRRAAKRLMQRGGMVFPIPTPDLLSVMERRRDVSAESIIDVGASAGTWSVDMMRFFPNARYFLIEASEHHHGDALRKFKSEHANVDYVICAAGDREGETSFFESPDQYGGAVSGGPVSDGNIAVPMSTVDKLVSERGLPSPYVLKLDTHGFEVPILEGAKRVMAESSMLIIETYLFTISPTALRFYELCAWLEPRGFRPADVFGLMTRPDDSVLWQMDIVFLPASHPAFKSNLYRPNPES